MTQHNAPGSKPAQSTSTTSNSSAPNQEQKTEAKEKEPKTTVHKKVIVGGAILTALGIAAAVLKPMVFPPHNMLDDIGPPLPLDPVTNTQPALKK